MKLKDDRGIWHEDKDGIYAVVSDYFSELFRRDECVVEPMVSKITPRVTEVMNQLLMQPLHR